MYGRQAVLRRERLQNRVIDFAGLLLRPERKFATSPWGINPAFGTKKTRRLQGGRV
jgi:hypothetical protein